LRGGRLIPITSNPIKLFLNILVDLVFSAKRCTNITNYLE
jgi:hypothetical protein